MMRDGIKPRIDPVVEWMKDESAGKSSLVLLNAGSPQNRDYILRNLKGSKGFTVTKSFPARYKEARSKLNEMGNSLMKMFDVNIEMMYDGISLGLWYRSKRKVGEERSDWIKHHEIDPTSEDVEKEKPIKIGGRSLFVNLKEDSESADILKQSIMAVLEDYGGKATYKAISVRQVGIFFQDVSETKDA